MVYIVLKNFHSCGSRRIFGDMKGMPFDDVILRTVHVQEFQSLN